MPTKKPLPPKKKSEPLAGQLLDLFGWAVREVALPVPDMLIEALSKKKKKK